MDKNLMIDYADVINVVSYQQGHSQGFAEGFNTALFMLEQQLQRETIPALIKQDEYNLQLISLMEEIRVLCVYDQFSREVRILRLLQLSEQLGSVAVGWKNSYAQIYSSDDDPPANETRTLQYVSTAQDLIEQYLRNSDISPLREWFNQHPRTGELQQILLASKRGGRPLGSHDATRLYVGRLGDELQRHGKTYGEIVQILKADLQAEKPEILRWLQYFPDGKPRSFRSQSVLVRGAVCDFRKRKEQSVRKRGFPHQLVSPT